MSKTRITHMMSVEKVLYANLLEMRSDANESYLSSPFINLYYFKANIDLRFLHCLNGILHNNIEPPRAAEKTQYDKVHRIRSLLLAIYNQCNSNYRRTIFSNSYLIYILQIRKKR